MKNIAQKILSILEPLLCMILESRLDVINKTLEEHAKYMGATRSMVNKIKKGMDEPKV